MFSIFYTGTKIEQTWLQAIETQLPKDQLSCLNSFHPFAVHKSTKLITISCQWASLCVDDSSLLTPVILGTNPTDTQFDKYCIQVIESKSYIAFSFVQRLAYPGKLSTDEEVEQTCLYIINNFGSSYREV